MILSSIKLPSFIYIYIKQKNPNLSIIPITYILFRFVQWRAFLVRRSKRWRGVRDDREQLELIEFQPGTVYKYYYTQEESDSGIMMETNIATKEVNMLKS